MRRFVILVALVGSLMAGVALAGGPAGYQLLSATLGDAGGRASSASCSGEFAVGQLSPVGAVRSANYRLEAGFLAQVTSPESGAPRFVYLPLVVKRGK